MPKKRHSSYRIIKNKIEKFLKKINFYEYIKGKNNDEKEENKEISEKRRKKQLTIKFSNLEKYKNLVKNRNYNYIAILIIILISLFFIKFGPYFKVKNINIIKKDNLVNIVMAYDLVNYLRGNNIFEIKEDKLFEKLKFHSQNIKKVDVDIILPNTLKIIIESHSDYFNTTINKKNYIITKNGAFVPSKKKKKLKNIEIIGKIPEFIEYKKVLDQINVENIYLLINSLEENIINIKIEKIYYYLKQREIHLKIKNNLLIFSIDGNILEQIRKTVIFNKEHRKIDKYGIYYTDLRVANKIFYCPIENEFYCYKHLQRTYK